MWFTSLSVLSHEAVGRHTPISYQIAPFIRRHAWQTGSVSAIIRVDATVNSVLLSTRTGWNTTTGVERSNEGTVLWSFRAQFQCTVWLVISVGFKFLWDSHFCEFSVLCLSMND